MSDAPRHFLDLSDFEGADLRAILEDAKELKEARAGLSKGTHEITAPLAGKIVALIFQQPSTRTRVSFEVGIRQLGGESLLISAGDTSGESRRCVSLPRRDEVAPPSSGSRVSFRGSVS